ncbi:MAG: peptidyl-prolyl cis-trans isomerase [bacterium]
MNKYLTLIVILVTISFGAKPSLPPLDTLYLYYAEQEYEKANQLLARLRNQNLSPEQRFRLNMEIGDYFLDKTNEYHRAESVYQQLLEQHPKHPQLPDLLYRLAITQELQEKFLEAAKNYEQVATQYFKSPYGAEALDAIERCFRKNYQERVAYVNGYPITRIELDERISRNPTQYETFDQKLALLDTMVNNRLLYEAAVAAKVENNPQATNTLIDTRNRAMFQIWYERYVTRPAEPTEKELKAVYKKNRSKYIIPEKVHAYQLVVTSKPLADSLHAFLTTDATKWDSVVKLHSITLDRENSGDLGFFAPGTRPTEIEQIAFQLKPGEISKPRAIRDTYYIIRVSQREPRKVKTFEEVKNQIAVELRQDRTTRIYEQEIARLKKNATIIQDTLAIEQNRETLAIVSGIPITMMHLEQRLNAIPPFFRGQFETPEGKRRILDQLVIEKLLLRECEKGKLWLLNRVVDQLINRKTALLVDIYRRQQTTEKIQLDSLTLAREYRENINDFKEPTRVRCREMVARTKENAEQLRKWALAGRIPALINGVAVLVTDEAKTEELSRTLAQTTNIDSIIRLGALAGRNVRIAGIPTHQIGGSDVVDLSQPCKIAGPFVTSDFCSFAFNNLSRQNKLYEPVHHPINNIEQLKSFLGEKQAQSVFETIDSTRFGNYVRLINPLPAEFINELFALKTDSVSSPYKTANGYLIVKITKKDTAQKMEFVEMIRRFSTSNSKWAGGEISLTRDDKARDKKVVDAAYSLNKGEFSPVIKLDDTTFTFIKMEEKKPAYTRPFAEVRSKIENKLRRAQEKELYDQLLKELRSKAKIEILIKEEDFSNPESVVEPKQ